MSSIKRNLILSISLISSFVLFTIGLLFIDRQAIGPLGSVVGYASMNKAIMELITFNEILFKITDYIMYVSVAVAALFVVIAIIQWIQRKSLMKVDHEILLLGLGYAVVILIYILFELAPVNYRPVLLDMEYPEPSYPSTHSMVSLFIFLSAITVSNHLLKDHDRLRFASNCILIFFAIFTVSGRLLSGAHWISDIIGGTLMSFGLYFLWLFFVDCVSNKKKSLESLYESK